MIESIERSALLGAQHPVALFSNGLGDHLLSLPALRAISRLFPRVLTLVCQPGARRLFFSDISLRAVCESGMRIDSGARNFDAYLVSQEVKECDLLISCNPWHSVAVDRLLQLLSPGSSIGFFPAFRVCIPLDYGKHAADLAFDIPKYVDPSLDIAEFSAPPAIVRGADALANSICKLLPSSVRILIVHTETKPEKMWPADRFVHTLDAFLGRHGDFVAVVIDFEDRQLDTGRFASRVYPCPGLSLEVKFEIIRRAHLFLGIDSCMLHAADLFRISGVGLFASTNCHEFGFRFSRHVHVVGKPDMGSIEETHVIDALERLLGD